MYWLPVYPALEGEGVMGKEYIYVLNRDGSPLMPTLRRRHILVLLKKRKAEMVSEVPFVVRLNYQSPGIVQPLYGGTDPGRTNLGEAIISDHGVVVYRSHIATRNKDIARLMAKRKQHRQASRRGERLARKRLAKKLGTTMKHILERKLPGYNDGVVTVKDIINTEAKFNNRYRPAGWLTPSATQLVRTHVNAIRKICRILPVTGWTLELNKFAFMKLDNGKCYGTDFQNGKLKGFPSIRAYITNRQDGHCALCDGPIGHIHHIEQRHYRGSDTVDNLIGLCRECHTKLHRGEITLDVKGFQKRYGGTSVLNQAIPYIANELTQMFGEEHTHFVTGHDTKEYRDKNKVAKDHDLDAVYIAAIGAGIEKITDIDCHCYEIVQFRHHDRARVRCQRTRTYKLGGKTVCKNRNRAFEQKDTSLAEYREKYPALVSKLTVMKSVRYYNNLHRIMPGAVFYFEGRRYVLFGQISKGAAYRAVGCGKTNFPAEQCNVVRRNEGLVYVS